MGVMPDDILPPHLLDVDQTPPVRDVKAQDDDVGLQERVVLRRRRVGEFEAVGAVVHADVVDEGLVHVS